MSRFRGSMVVSMAGRAIVLGGVVFWGACPRVASEPQSVAPAPAAQGGEYAPLAIRLSNNFYNRPKGFKVRDGCLRFMHLDGSAAIPVESLSSQELAQFPQALRDQVAAEVVASAKRREEKARLAEQGGADAPSARPGPEGAGTPRYNGSYAGPRGSIRFIPSAPAGGGGIEVEKVLPKAGGSLDGRTADGTGGFDLAPQPSREVKAAVEAHGRLAQSIISNDLGVAVGELELLASLSPPSRSDGEYIDAAVLDASWRVLDAALSLDDAAAGERAVSLASSVGGTRPEVVKFLQGAFGQICLKADQGDFRGVDAWIRSLEGAGSAYGIVLEMGRQRVAKRVLKSGWSELCNLHFRSAWDAYVLSKALWVNNPELSPIGLAVGVGGAVAIALAVVIIFKLADGLRALAAWQKGKSRARGNASRGAAGGGLQRRPSTGPRPVMRQRPEANDE